MQLSTKLLPGCPCHHGPKAVNVLHVTTPNVSKEMHYEYVQKVSRHNIFKTFYIFLFLLIQTLIDYVGHREFSFMKYCPLLSSSRKYLCHGRIAL